MRPINSAIIQRLPGGHKAVSSGLRLAVCSFVVLILFPLNPVLAQSIACSDLTYLIEQSQTGFKAILDKTDSEFGGRDTTIILPNAQYCVILEDQRKRSYKCTWTFGYGAEQAQETFEKYAKDVSNCLGSSASESKDQLVNHPDTYYSHLYRISNTDLRVTLKNKGALRNTLVSVIVDGLPFRESDDG